MRSTALAASLVAAGATIALTAAGPEAEASPGKCLRFRDMRGLTQVDDRTLIADSRSRTKYKVTLRHACRQFGWPGNFYTVRLFSDTECFDRDDVLVLRWGGACFVDSVTPIPAS